MSGFEDQNIKKTMSGFVFQKQFFEEHFAKLIPKPNQSCYRLHTTFLHYHPILLLLNSAPVPQGLEGLKLNEGFVPVTAQEIRIQFSDMEWRNHHHWNHSLRNEYTGGIIQTFHDVMTPSQSHCYVFVSRTDVDSLVHDSFPLVVRTSPCMNNHSANFMCKITDNCSRHERKIPRNFQEKNDQGKYRIRKIFASSLRFMLFFQTQTRIGWCGIVHGVFMCKINDNLQQYASQ